MSEKVKSLYEDRQVFLMHHFSHAADEEEMPEDFDRLTVTMFSRMLDDLFEDENP